MTFSVIMVTCSEVYSEWKYIYTEARELFLHLHQESLHSILRL